MHHHHDHMHDGPASGPGADAGFDAGTESLSRALGMCFTVLKVVMVVLVAAYLFSGIYTVQPHEKALRLHFGEVIEEVEPGGHIAWPFPIDEIVKMDANKVRDLEIGTFWYSTAEGRGEKAMREEREELRNVPKGERVKGMGGYVLTGDVNILHYYWTVRYKISDPLHYYRNVAGEEVGKYDYADSLVRFAVESGVVRNVNTHEVYDALQNEVQAIARAVQKVAQDILDKQLESASGGTGIEIVQVVASMPPIPPRSVRGAFDDVFQAREDRSRQIETAEGFVNERLGAACGAVGRPIYDAFTALDMSEDALSRMEAIKELVADIDKKLAEKDGKDEKLVAEKKALLDEMAQVQRGGPRLARQIRERISDQFLGEEAGQLKDYDSLTAKLPAVIDRMYADAEGAVAAELNAAKTYKEQVKELVRADVERIAELKKRKTDLDTYLDQIRLMAVKDVIAGAEDVYILKPSKVDGETQIRLKISSPPELLKKKRAVQETR